MRSPPRWLGWLISIWIIAIREQLRVCMPFILDVAEGTGRKPNQHHRWRPFCCWFAPFSEDVIFERLFEHIRLSSRVPFHSQCVSLVVSIEGKNNALAYALRLKQLQPLQSSFFPFPKCGGTVLNLKSSRWHQHRWSIYFFRKNVLSTKLNLCTSQHCG